jgi:uncharacterized protein YegP (UPF0339 family)
MAGWYELAKSSNGQYRFVLKAGNSEVILTSELYKSIDAARNGIASVQAHAADDSRYSISDAANGKHYFNLKAANHQVIGTSQMYASAEARDVGMASAKANGATATVKDLT